MMASFENLAAMANHQSNTRKHGRWRRGVEAAMAVESGESFHLFGDVVADKVPE
jgi:hypothetical protein